MTDFASQGAIVNYGAAVGRVGVDAVTPATDVYTALGQISAIGGPSSEKASIDVTTLEDLAKEFISDIPDNGQISLTMMLDGSLATHQAVRADADANDRLRNWQVQINDDAVAGNRTILDFEAEVMSWGLTQEVGGAVSVDVTIKVIGAVTPSWHA